MKDFRTPEFTDTLCYSLANVYARLSNADEKPYTMVTSLFERFASAHSKGAIFYGPIALTHQKGSAFWRIEDLRGGWGYDPLNIDLLVNGDEPPTLEAVIQRIRERAESLRRDADFHESTANFLEENKPI